MRAQSEPLMQKTTGTSLIEILISLLLISILLLGIDAAQIASLQLSSANYYLAIAEQQINAMNERLTLLKNMDINPYVAVWNKQNQEVLPQGKGVIHDGEISVFWGNRDEQNCKTNKIGADGCLHLRI